MAITERYVTTTGAGAHDGTSEANAFSWTEMITDINTPRVGYRYNVKQGTYSLSASSTITGDGSTTSPNIIRGYKTTIGDATIGRASGGALDSSNMPTIAYNATFSLSISGGTNTIVEALKITGARSGLLISLTTESMAYNCIVENTSSNSSAIGISVGAGTASAISCDVTLASGVAGAICIDNGGTVIGCRVNGGSAATGIRAANNGDRAVAFNTIYNCTTGITKTTTSATCSLFNNTIYNCSGDGIDVVTSSTALCFIHSNHITNCGGYGIDFNTSTCSKFLFNNRFRDCTSGSYNGDGDYGTAGKQRDATTDTGGPETDFTNYSGADFSLIAGSPGISAGLGYLIDIGANGTPVVTGGGGMIGGGNLSGGFQ